MDRGTHLEGPPANWMSSVMKRLFVTMEYSLVCSTPIEWRLLLFLLTANASGKILCSVVVCCYFPYLTDVALKCRRLCNLFSLRVVLSIASRKIPVLLYSIVTPRLVKTSADAPLSLETVKKNIYSTEICTGTTIDTDSC